MNTDAFLGLTESKAIMLASLSNLRYRCTGKNGVAYVVTMDFRTDRVNVRIENDVVVRAYIG